MGQTVLSRMFSKYMWLQLWFSNMLFYHKMWEHHTYKDKNVGVFKFAHTQTCVHMNSYGKGIIYLGSLDVGSQKFFHSDDPRLEHFRLVCLSCLKLQYIRLKGGGHTTGRGGGGGTSLIFGGVASSSMLKCPKWICHCKQ